MTKLSEIGEFGLIKRFSKSFLDNLPEGITGIGDDCSIIPYSKTESLLVTTDMLIEDRHFLRNRISPYELGYKSLAVNLSDIAAMGGIPQSAFLSLGIPSTVDVEWIDIFFKGLKDLANETGTLLLGGDTTKSPDRLVVNVAVIGKAETKNIKKRSTARPGDIICVTGLIGDSGGGLISILKDISLDEDVKYLVKQHHLPVPHIKQGKWLSLQKGVNAMMDVSDGIESDIRRIMEASDVGAEIFTENLPVSKQLVNVATKNKWNYFDIALSGGEDYCLLLTVKNELYPDISKRFEEEFNNGLTEIGRITEKSNILDLLFKGEKIKSGIHGFDHFK